MRIPRSWLGGLSAILFASLSSAAPEGSADLETRAASCNGSPDLCALSYGAVTHLGAHDSPFVRSAANGFSLAGNQYVDAVAALDAGVRLLQGQVHAVDGVLRLCHTSCQLYDAGPLRDWLAGVAKWVESHPNDVVTILLVNGGKGSPVDEFGAAFESSGIGRFGFVPAAPRSWPTLGDMVSSGKRVVTFIESIALSAKYPYLLNQFDYVFETAYLITTPTGFNCSLDRPAARRDLTSVASAKTAISEGMLPLLNHFRYTELSPGIHIPDATNVNATNGPSESAPGALGLHARRCVAEWGVQRPTFVLVDFFDRGPALETSNKLNGVPGAGGGGDGTTPCPPTAGISCKLGNDSSTTGPKANEATPRRTGGTTIALLAFLAMAVMCY
jgi:hypothetical protein